MGKNIETCITKFYGRKKTLLIEIIIGTIFVIYILFFDNMRKKENSERTAPIIICFVILTVIMFAPLILCYISNKKSYIELRNSKMKIKMPKIYPFPKMIIKELAYNEIGTIKIQPSRYSGSLGITGGLMGYKIIITTKEEIGKKIKFYGLDDGKGLNKELQNIGIKPDFIE